VSPINKMVDRDIRRAEMQILKDAGVAGLKVDFFEGDKQDRMQQYIGILEDALDFELLINFHGCTLPRGWERRFPNLMTMEAVRGAEAYNPKIRPTAIHNVRLPMIRNVVGSMDFTPVMFHSRCVTNDPESQDYSFTLATAIAFESGLAHYPSVADKQKSGYQQVFKDCPEAGRLLDELPTTWDETKLLSGDLDSHCFLARRKGARWYLGGLNGKTTESQKLSVPCDFLSEGSYDMIRIESDGKKVFKVTNTVVSKSDSINAELPIGAGISIMLIPQQ